MEAITTLFWKQLAWIQRECYIADGTYLTVVTANKTLFEGVRRALTNFQGSSPSSAGGTPLELDQLLPHYPLSRGVEPRRPHLEPAVDESDVEYRIVRWRSVYGAQISTRPTNSTPARVFGSRIAPIRRKHPAHRQAKWRHMMGEAGSTNGHARFRRVDSSSNRSKV